MLPRKGRRFKRLRALLCMQRSQAASFKAGPPPRPLETPFAAVQDPWPGLGEKNFSNLSGTPCISLASAGGSPFWLILGQVLAYSAFTDSHFSRPDSVSALMASGGHSGSQTP